MSDQTESTSVPSEVQSLPAPESKETPSGKEAVTDPYAYLDRNGFTSEKYKIEIRGLPKYYGMKEIKKLLNNKLQLNSTKIKVPAPRSSWIYVCFPSEEEKTNAIKVLQNYEWKNCLLKVEEAKPIPDPLVQKRLQNSSPDEPSSKRVKTDCGIVEQLKDATTPLWRLSLEEQLNKKVQQINGLLRKYGNELIQVNKTLSKWFESQKSQYKGLPCEVLPIRHASYSNGYRNKCEFSVGINEETGEKTVGFRLSSYVKGSVCVAPIDQALNVPEKMKVAVNAFQKFVQNSDLDVYSPEFHSGYWQQLTARYGFNTDQLMLIVGINPQKLTKSELDEVKGKIRQFFVEDEGKSCNVTSLFLQQLKKKKSQAEEPIYEHVFGETHITEKLLGRTFRISPQAFFQVNTGAAEILYSSINDLAGLTPEVTLLDVCCGTGSIGISLSDKCGEVLGLEISSEAIEDAQVNALTNNVKNAQFFAGKAEEILSCVAQKSTKEDIVAIVDPPRAGLQRDALIQLRRTERINKLVFVSCDPRAAIKNFVDLGRDQSKIYRGEPFLPVKAIPVDLFPLTPHCELLIYFERRRSS